jgi:hypothetical protein
MFTSGWRLSAGSPGGDLGDVLVDGGAADAEQPGDGGDGVVRPGQQVAGVADLLGGHGRRPSQARAAGAGGVQSLAGALDDQLDPHAVGEGLLVQGDGPAQAPAAW